jgi:hypothetical protein
MAAATVTVPFGVPAGVAYDYLLEPANRPQWQRSLRDVEVPDGPRVPGLRWRDVTRVPGLRLPLELAEADRPRRWVEVASWRGFTGRLACDFAPSDDGCEVTATFTLDGWGLGPLLTRLGEREVRRDLERAAKLVG